MSDKLKNSFRKTQKAGLNRPFNHEVLARANAIVAKYTVLLQPNSDVGFFGRGLEFPYAMADGKTPDECMTNTREALVAVVATMLEHGKVPPAPASEENRTEQVNIRVTAEEKLLLENAARINGFRGISDFVRNASLAGTR